MAWNFIATATQGFTSTSQVPLSSFPFAISCWFYPTTTGAVQTLVSFAGSTATNNRIELQLTASGSCQAISQTATNNRAALTTNTVKPGWNHFFGLFESNVNRFAMLNGGPGVQNSVSSPIATPTRFAIGIDATSAGTAGADGRMAELAIFNRKLSFQEMQFVAAGNSPLLLNNPNGTLRFYRNFDKAFHDAELGDFDRVKMTRTTSPPTPCGPNNFQKKYATAELVVDRAIATLLRSAITTFNQTLAATAVGVVAFVKGVSTNQTVTTVGVTSDILSVGKNMKATAVGVPTLSALRAIGVTLAAVAVGVAAMVRRTGKNTAATAVGTAAFVKGVSSNLKVTVIGVTGRVLSVGKNLGATAVGVPTLNAIRAFLVTLAAIAVGVPAMVKQVGKNTAATAVGVSTVIRMTAKGLAGSAIGLVTIVASFIGGAGATAVALAATAIGIAAMSLSFIAGTVTTVVRNRLPGGGGIGLYGLSDPRSRFMKRRRK